MCYSLRISGHFPPAIVNGGGDRVGKVQFSELHIGLCPLADLTGGHTCSGRRGPCPKWPRRPHGRCAQEAIKCHVTATKRKTCIANKSSAVYQMGDRLATIDMGRKLGGVPLFSRGGAELGPHLTQCRLGRGLPPYQVASWFIQPFGHNTPTSQTDRQHRRERTDSGPIA